MRILVSGLMTALLVFAGVPALSAPSSGGGGVGGGVSSTPQKTPEQLAHQYYRQGVKHKEKAWKQEQKALNASTDKKRQKALVRVAKEYQNAIEDLSRSLSYDINSYEAANEFGYCLRKTGDYAKALGAYNHALKLKPDFYPAIEYRAEAYLGLGYLQEAREAYLLLFREQPDLAAQLMVAMESWSRENEEPDDSTRAFSSWIEERARLSAITQDLSLNNTRTW